MSVNRSRGGRRAYLKHVVSRHDPSPDAGMKAAIGLGRDINPINALPHRARLWLDTNKHTPTMTEPMRERVESWHTHIKERPNEYFVSMVDTPLQCIRMFFTRFDSDPIPGLWWFKKLDKITQIEKESYTYGSRARAIHAYENNRVRWR